MPSKHAFAIGVVIVLAATPARSDETSLTIYNQNFAVVRETIRLELQPGENQLRFNEVTAHLEPDSVILRDPTGKRRLRILEQDYRSDPLSQGLLLSLYEGRSIDFLIAGRDEPVAGRVVRSGYVPHRAAWNQYGQQYYMRQAAYTGGGLGQPIIKIEGRLRFGLPGIPLFPDLGDETILEPTLHWVIETDAAGPAPAELSYVTGGMSWKADYNLVTAGSDDVLDLAGWVTMDNQSGRTFEEARIKLMAGDVNKLAPKRGLMDSSSRELRSALGGAFAPAVTEKSFDEYHLYTLARPTTLRDRQTKQVEFVRAQGIESSRFYVYDGVLIDHNYYRGWNHRSIRENAEYGALSSTKVWTMREFANTADNGLGMPLPRGRLRFYQRDDDGQLEFVGENDIDHTPKDETVRVYTGNAFDLIGQRKRIEFAVKSAEHWLDESFEVKLRNHKDKPVEIRVVEHLYRWNTWELKEHSHPFTKTDAQTIEFRVQVPPDGEVTLDYTVHYTW